MTVEAANRLQRIGGINPNNSCTSGTPSTDINMTMNGSIFNCLDGGAKKQDGPSASDQALLNEGADVTEQANTATGSIGSLSSATSGAQTNLANVAQVSTDASQALITKGTIDVNKVKANNALVARLGIMTAAATQDLESLQAQRAELEAQAVEEAPTTEEAPATPEPAPAAGGAGARSNPFATDGGQGEPSSLLSSNPTAPTAPPEPSSTGTDNSAQIAALDAKIAGKTGTIATNTNKIATTTAKTKATTKSFNTLFNKAQATNAKTTAAAAQTADTSNTLGNVAIGVTAVGGVTTAVGGVMASGIYTAPASPPPLAGGAQATATGTTGTVLATNTVGVAATTGTAATSTAAQVSAVGGLMTAAGGATGAVNAIKKS